MKEITIEIFGFEQFTKYTIVQGVWLKSLENQNISFTIRELSKIPKEKRQQVISALHSFEGPSNAEKFITGKKTKPRKVYFLVTLEKDGSKTLNLKAPIVVEGNKARQVILPENLEIKYKV